MTVTEINPLPIPEHIIRMEEMWDSLRQEPQLIAPPRNGITKFSTPELND